MDANLKLLKKKRVAHTGSKLPSMSCDEPKLPPDDFVYNIMKDMDKKKNVISYQQFQEIKSQKRQDASINEEIFSYHNKKAKKMLPKKIYPLMKKCQTNLKHLKKNRCIPKPRAHVGPAPKPQFKPILNVEKNITKFQHGLSNNINKDKQSNGTFKSAISQPAFKVCKTSNFKSCVHKETVNRVQKKDEVDEQLSSSDDDAFENFVQKAANEKENDSSDSDSRLVIHRKRSKTKSKQIKKKTNDLFSDNEVNRKTPKVTSRPLSDSSESEGQETFESTKNKRNSFKRRKYSERELPMRLQEHETFNISLSEDDSQDLGDINRDSSDSESNLEVPTSNLLSINQSNIFNHTALKSDNNKVTHGANNVDISNINFDSSMNYSEPTKSIPMCNIPCYVRLIRDPDIDKKAMHFCLTTPILPTSNMYYSSDDDCIIINENSDSEEIPEVPKSQACSSFSTSWPCEDTDPGGDTACEIPHPQPIESNTTRDCSSSKSQLIKTQANTTVQIHNLDKINNLSNSNNFISVAVTTSIINPQNSNTETDVDECIIVCEKSKSDIPEKSLEISDSSISEKNADPDLSQAKDKLPSAEHNEANVINSEEQDFNVKIVAVRSLTELVEPSAPESNVVEVVDLSDDDSPVPDTRENNSAAKENIIDVSDSIHILNQNGRVVKDNESNSSLKCEPNPKILEILNKIDFESLKEVMSKIKVEKSINEFCEAGEISTSSNLLPLCTSIPMPTCDDGEISREINSTNRIGFRKQNSKFDNKNDQLHYSLEPTPEKSDSQVRNLNEFSGKLSDSQLVGSVRDSAPKCAIDNSVKDFHTNNQTSNQPLSVSSLEVKTSFANDEITNTLFKVCTTEILAEVSSENLVKETNPFLKVNSINPSSLGNRTATSATDMLPIHSKQNSENVSNKFCETVQNSMDAVCKGLKVPELQTKVEQKIYPGSICRTTTSNIAISNKGTGYVPELADKPCKISKIGNEKSLQNFPITQPVKKEIVIESPSDELDVVAASFIKDLKPSNKSVLTLLDVYKKEYEKYKDIKTTEFNVNAGLKLLHDQQLKKLIHLHASIKNLAKHDACLYKINQEDNCDGIKISMKNEITDKRDLMKEENSESLKELKREESPLPEKGVQVETKFDSSGPSREKVYGIMMSIKCAQCGKPATARCQGCASIFYCSSHCGEQSWRQGHYAVCKKS